MQQLQNLPNLPSSSLEILQKGKNLLAFSGGVDSSALFFILKAYKINFDICIVDYGMRKQSKQEVAYAIKLAKTFNKKIYLKNVDLATNNFEYNARIARYDFFKQIIKEKNYTNLITAHQLNDKLEWFFMQFSKGAGVVELLGLQEIQKRDCYNLVRPMLELSKNELFKFLNSNNIKFFIDESNKDTKYKRNFFRENFSNEFINNFQKGVIKSFQYLQNDKNLLYEIEIVKNIQKLFILKDLSNNVKNIRAIDCILKKLGYILSKPQKDEIIKTKNLVISNHFSIVFANNLIYISPFVKTKMDKTFKEKCRILKIPPKIRGYLYQKKFDLSFFEDENF